MKFIQRQLSDKKSRTILWTTLSAVLLIGTMIMLFLGYRISKGLEDQMKKSLVRICNQNVKLVETEISGRQASLKGLASRLLIEDDTDLRELTDTMKEYSQVFGFYDVGLFGTDGRGYTTRGETYNLGDRDYFQKALTGEQFITESRLSEAEQMNLNILVTPVVNQGQVKAVLTATYRSEDLLDMMNVGFFHGKGQNLVLDAEGKAVCVPEDTNGNELYELADFISNDPELGDSTREHFQQFEYEGKLYIAYNRPMQVNDWHLISYIPYDAIYSEVRVLKLSVLAALALMYICTLVASGSCMWIYRRMSERLVSIAFQDDLTMAKNYEYLKVYFKSLSGKEKADRYMAVFDIDKFKFINMLYGNREGDRLLKYILKVYQETLPEAQIFKGSADIFIGIIQGKTDRAVEEAIQLFIRELEERARGNRISPFQLSFGICRLDQGNDLRSVYDNALLAKREAKVSMKKKYKFFDSIERKEVRKRAIEASFETALHNGEFQAWYQPKYDMEKKAICGAEALVRWKKPDGTMMSPGDFIPVLEENGRIVELDEEILRIVCRDLVEAKAQGMPLLPVSVNLSKVHLVKRGTAEAILDITDQYHIDRSMISFEITESAAYGDKTVLNNLADQLRESGFQVDMDDYGTGSSTLTSLAETNFDTLKLDKSFIDRIGTEKMDIILKSTIRMARKLSMKLVAEGVENQEQAQFLLENGCSVIQGYYFSKPLERGSYWRLLEGEKNEATV